MGSDVMKLGDFKETVTQRVRLLFSELIPEETLKKFIDEEYDKFIKQDARTIIKEEMMAVFREMVKKEINTPEWQTQHTHWGSKARPAIHALMVELAPIISQNLIEYHVQGAVERFRQILNQNGGRIW